MEKRTIADFSLGEWNLANVDLKQPGSTVRALVDGYIDRSGIPRARGPVAQKITTPLNYSAGKLVWAGTLLPGRRAIVYSDNGGLANGSAQRFNPDTAAFSGTPYSGIPIPSSYTVVGNTLWLAGPNSGGTAIFHWGGSLKNTQLLVTNIVRTAGSKVITRAAGGFVSSGNYDVGMIIRDWTAGLGGPAVVASIDSDTQMTMDRPSPLTDNATRTFWSDPVFAQVVGTALTGAGVSVVGSIAGRLLILEKHRLIFSRGPDPATGGPRTEQFQIGDLHEFPVDAVGVALATLRDRVFVFTEAGNFAVSGMAYELVDGSGQPQHPIEQLTGKSVALGQKGIVTWQGALIVPCRDGIYVMDGYGAPVLLSRSVPWAEMVRGGLQVGYATIYKERYILPYTYGGQTAQMVFRTDGADTEFGTVFSKTTFAMPPNVFAVATDKNDSLLAVGDQAGGVLEAGQAFTEGGHNGQDYDGSAAGGTFVFNSGPVPIGDKGLVRRVRVRYTWLNGTTTATPQLRVRVVTKDGNHIEEKLLAIDTTVPSTRWVALDLDTPAEGDVIEVDIGLVGAKPSGFAMHALEIQYRAFGGM